MWPLWEHNGKDNSKAIQRSLFFTWEQVLGNTTGISFLKPLCTHGGCFIICGCAMSAQANVLETLVSRLMCWKHWSQFILYERLWILREVEASWRNRIWAGAGDWRVIVCPCLLPALSLLIQQDKAKHISTGIAKNALNHHAFHTMMNSTPNREPKWTPHPLKLFFAMYLITITRKNIDSVLRMREYTFFSNYSWVHSWNRFL